MRRKLPITKDKRRQKRIIASAQRQTDRIGLDVHFSFNENGEMLIDGKTADEIDATYDQTITRFYKENAADLDADLIQEKAVEKTDLTPIHKLPPVYGPHPYNNHPVVFKFEQNKYRG